MNPPRHLVLVGPMGAGKTRIGTLLSGATGLPLVDNDRVLTATEGENAAELARERGVDALHDRECRQLLTALATPEPSIVGAAASTVENPSCRAALGGHFVAWLRAAPETVAQRLDEATHRRDLGPDPVATLRALADRRDPLYAAVADVVVDVDAVTPTEACRIISDAYAEDVHTGRAPDGRE
jgi:shikimate kinase